LPRIADMLDIGGTVLIVGALVLAVVLAVYGAYRICVTWWAKT
jgi:hypothetical protein